jgi:hypothetical protein
MVVTGADALHYCGSLEHLHTTLQHARARGIRARLPIETEQAVPTVELIDRHLLAEIWRVMPEGARIKVCNEVFSMAQPGLLNWETVWEITAPCERERVKDALCGWFIMQCRREAGIDHP